HTSDPALWSLADGSVSGHSKLFDGDKTDPAASTFLVSNKVFGGDIAVTMNVSFQKGRYIGVYLDFGQESQSGIWMATGHALPADAADNEIERGYVKTVENGFWIVRASGELVINGDEIVHLRFDRRDDDYSLYQDDRLIATYRKPGGYPAGRLQIRLTNASVRIHELRVESDWSK
ncbi:MAG: hypothetical protein ACI88G_000804, partial [Woeseiaceae bacterium]